MTLKGKVLTVLGPKDPTELGVVLPHEQPLLDLTGLYRKPAPAYEELTGDISSLDLQLNNLGKIRQFPYSVKANLVVDDENEVISELKLYKAAGGGTLCDVSPVGVRLKRDSLPTISKQTSVHIIAGTSFYVESLMPEEVKKMTVEEMTDFLVGEVLDGIGGGGVRCGIIGEVGCSYPLTENEKKSLQASAKAQHRTGAPLMIHSGVNENSPFEILDILEPAGADLSHTVIGHMDRTMFKDEDVLRLARRGCYLEYDLFGVECSHSQTLCREPEVALSFRSVPSKIFNPSNLTLKFNQDIDFPSDAQKIQKVKLLVDNGYSGQVLISTDVHTKHRMACCGGHGYTHILENIAPKLEARGVSKEVVTQIIIKNPQEWLTFI